MAEKLTTPSHEQSDYAPRIDMDAPERTTYKLNWKGKLAATALATSVVAGIGVGGAKLFEETPVGSTIEHVPAGGSPIGTVEAGVEEIAEQHGFELNDVSGIIGAGQEVAGELHASHPGEPILPGEAIKVTVVKNGLGQLSVNADPANLGTPSK